MTTKFLSCSCGGALQDGNALVNTPEGVPDFFGCEVVTMSGTGAAYLQKCLKCEHCGKSYTIRRGL